MSYIGIAESFVKNLSKLACRMPERSGRVLFASIGILLSKFWINERNRLKDVISRVYNRAAIPLPANLNTIINRMFIHFSLNIFEIMRFPTINTKLLNEKFTFYGENNLKQALNRKKGVILALPHIGNWELLGTAIAHKNYPLNSFYLAQKENKIGSLLDYFRSFSKIILHDRDRGAIKALRALKKGEILGMIADQDGANKGVYMNFLEHWVSMPAGPANWGLRTEAAIVPLYSLRIGTSNKFKAYFMKPIYPIHSDNHINDVKLLTKQLADWMQNLILKYPHQYLWFYDRFKPRHEAYISKHKLQGAKMRHGEIWYAD